jgi:ParB-like chromosome segregation protein Spo0J
MERNIMKIEYPVMTDLKMVKYTDIKANTYNPNSVSRDKMDLLKQSIIDNGFLFPIIVIYDGDLEQYVIVDGFHRYRILGELQQEEIPVVVLKHDITKRMYTTIQMNKAKGEHQVDLDAEVIRALLEQGQDELEISKHLGIDIETIHRYKQTGGIADIFKNVDYSPSWSMEEVEEDE